MITGHSCYPSISSKPSLLEYWIKVDTELPPSSTSLSPLEIPHNIGSGAKSADDIYALPAIEDKLYGYIPESFGKNIPQTLTGWLNWSVKQDYPTYQFLAKLGKLQPRFGAIGKLAESMEHLGPTISIHEPNAEGGIHSQDDTAAEDSALKASFLGRVNNGIPVEHLITIETKHLPSSLSPFKNPQSISSDAKSADESHAVPMIERSSSVYGYVPGSLKNVARAITGWLNRPGEDDYSGYQQLAKLVRLRASDEDVRKIAESINHSGPTIVIHDSKAGGKIESKNDTDAVVFAFKAALRVLEKSSLSYRERYWALGLFACLRNKLIPSILHSCDQHLLDPQKRKYRGQLEIFLMGGVCFIVDSTIPSHQNALPPPHPHHPNTCNQYQFP